MRLLHTLRENHHFTPPSSPVSADIPSNINNTSRTWQDAGLPANFYSTLRADQRILTSVQRLSDGLNLKLRKIEAKKINLNPIEIIAKLTEQDGNAAIALVWNSEEGQSYHVERSEDLEDCSDIVATAITASGTLTSYLHVDTQLPPHPIANHVYSIEWRKNKG